MLAGVFRMTEEVAGPGKHDQEKNILNALVIRDENISMVTLQSGDIPIMDKHAYGLYHRDCRFLSGYELRIGDKYPVNILSGDERGFSSITVMTNPQFRDRDGNLIKKDTISIRRDRAIAGLVIETITIQNFNEFGTVVDIILDFRSNFEDIFTIRDITGKTEGKIVPPKYENGSLVITYIGRDGHTRNTSIAFDPHPDSVDGGTCRFAMQIGPHQAREIVVRIEVEDIPHDKKPQPCTISFDEKLEKIKASYMVMAECCSNIQTDNFIFDKIFMRSLSDLRMLQMSLHGKVFHSAGVPWYDALFGRDSIISAIQLLPYNNDVAKSTLELHALYQGKSISEWRDEEPGKMLHELRVGEKANLNEVPQTPYYGTVDATALFLILLSEYVDWTGDIEFFKGMVDIVDRALKWIDEYTDMEGNGLVYYSSRSPRGLYNQGWKDSHNAISHSDGTLARHPIALSEVQGYVHLAKKRLSSMYRRIGMEDVASKLAREAKQLWWKFNESFWMDDKKFYAQALDDIGVCDVISSNPGQALWGEIIDKKRIRDVVDRLFQPDMFTGWGIRTLSSKEKLFNPLGYHNGTVWPHDNSMIAMGLNKYGYKGEAGLLFSSMYQAAGFYPLYRLPELFGGFHRQDYDIPIKYPAACSPQAWSAGTMPYLLTATLGLWPDALSKRLTLTQPKLPPWLSTVRIYNLKVGEASVDLELKRIGESTLVNVMEKHGEMEVNVVY